MDRMIFYKVSTFLCVKHEITILSVKDEVKGRLHLSGGTRTNEYYFGIDVRILLGIQ